MVMDQKLVMDDDGRLSLVTVLDLGHVESPGVARHLPSHLDGDLDALRDEWRGRVAEARAERDLAESEYRSMAGF